MTSAIASLTADAIPRDLLPKYLAALATWMGLVAAISVYASHRIEILHQAATAARRLGQYQLKRRLGSGGMGEVYLAEHVLLRRPCALKLIRPERAGDPEYLRRFEREVQATAALTHPNTVQVFDYGHAEDGTFYFAMEYLPGLTLQELVHRYGPVPAERAVYLLRQVCGALKEAHAVGLIHRDVKPGNVVVCERGGLADVVKLLDFGLVRRIDAEEGITVDSVVTGTPAYMSPEQAAGGEDLDARSDIYAVGSLAYFLLTGRPPFVDRTVVRVLAAHLYEAPEPPSRHRPEVPPDLENVVLRCLAKSPSDRFPDVASLDTALARCASPDRWTTADAAVWWRSHTGAGDAVCEVTQSVA
jgi:serine/threonine-protein kinase